MELGNEILGNLSEEMRAKVAECETPEDLLELAASEDVDLTEEQMKALYGGSGDYMNGCYACYT